MGRRIPVHKDPLVHPVLSFPLLLAGIAATIALIAALCGARSRKGSSRPPSPRETTEKFEAFDSPAPKSIMTPPTRTPSPTAPAPEETTYSTDSKEPEAKQLPPPPAMKSRRETYSGNLLTKAESDRKLTMSLSMKLPRSLSMARREENIRRKKEKLNQEDSIWMKTIILGEKCRVPDDEDDSPIYDAMGNRISTYHPRTPPNLFPLSRQSSFNEGDPLASHRTA